MNSNKTHTFTNGRKFTVRVIQQNDCALISAEDLARCLGHTPPDTLLQRVDPSVRHNTRLRVSKSRSVDAPTVTTFGALSLILESRSSDMMQVLAWFCQNVLPTLKTWKIPQIDDHLAWTYYGEMMRKSPKHWQETFSFDFCSALLGAFSITFGPPRLKQELQRLIGKYVYDGFIEALPVKCRIQCQDMAANQARLHEYIQTHLNARFQEHLSHVESLALACVGSELEFRDAYEHFFLGREQLQFGFITPRREPEVPEELSFELTC